MMLAHTPPNPIGEFITGLIMLAVGMYIAVLVIAILSLKLVRIAIAITKERKHEKINKK